MSLDLKPSRYYRPIPLTDKELRDLNRTIVNVGVIYSNVYYYHNDIEQIRENLHSPEPYVFFVPCNGRYHDLEFQPLTETSGCHYYSGLVHFDLYYYFYGPEAKGACCDGKDHSCSACNNVIVLKRWWRKFKGAEPL